MEECVKKQIEGFSIELADRLNDSNFSVDHEGYLASMGLGEIVNLVSSKDVVACEEMTAPDIEEYTDMITE
eukprot:839659-Ditylum_brightwellii.AAC.2